MPWDDRPLVGRGEELARLVNSVERALEGRSCAVLVAGDAGVGKTRLLDELAARAADRGFRVLTGHCVDLGDVGLPYLPFVDLLRPVAGAPVASAGAAQPALAGLLAGRVAAGTGELPSGEPADLGRPLPHPASRPVLDDGRLQLFESVAALLGELAAAAPLLVVLEDLHWADRSSRDLLRYLLARLVDEPVALVASYRSDDLHRRHPLRPLLAELVRLPGVERLELGPLPDAAVGELVRDLARGVPESTVEDVVARAEGNAFYAEELLAAGLAGETLPMALTDVLLTRVEQLGEAAQRVLRVAAVAGRRVRHDLVAAVSGLAPAELEAALAEAVHRHLLVVSGDGRYLFRHALLREAVLADLLPGERVRLHAAIAGHLAATPGAGTAAELAHHARGSNDLTGAFSASLEAAAAAGRVGAPAEQLQHLEAALALWPAVPDAAERAGRDQGTLLLDTAAASCTGPSPCCTRPSSCSGRTATRSHGHGCTTRSPRRWGGSRTRRPRTGRAAGRWRWYRPGRPPWCAPGPRRRTPAPATTSACGRRGTPLPTRRSPPPTRWASTAPGPTPRCPWPGCAAPGTGRRCGPGWRRRWRGPAAPGTSTSRCGCCSTSPSSPTRRAPWRRR